MKKLITILICFFVVAVFTQCRHYSGNWKVYFWKSSPQSSVSYLYINDEYKGELPYRRTAPECDDASLANVTLYVKMKSGTYDIAVKDQGGNTKFNEKLTIKRSNGSVTIATSQERKNVGSKNVSHSDCLVHEIFY